MVHQLGCRGFDLDRVDYDLEPGVPLRVPPVERCDSVDVAREIGSGERAYLPRPGEAGGGKTAEVRKGKTVPLPEVDFASFVLTLSSSALFHFGEFPDPVSGKRERNLDMAKQTIDILGVLRDKTRGNLSNDEEQLMDSLLHDLRIKYVEECKKG